MRATLVLPDLMVLMLFFWSTVFFVTRLTPDSWLLQPIVRQRFLRRFRVQKRQETHEVS